VLDEEGKKLYSCNKETIGYVRITDFGIARIWRPENSEDTSGTPGYMGNYTSKSFIISLAPEVMCRQNHGVSVDYFAVGVMAFECMFGRVGVA
jgi:serine/threonine protein kinase